MVKGDVLVSIKCWVYNHEPYLRQCLDGFVMQKTNFAFEAIVHDDASTDGSSAIIREYAERYPNIIKPIIETENQYSKRDGSLNRIMNAAMSPSSKYIALCEGDDYWIDPLKLQKQVDFLESHKDYGMCYSRAYVLEGDSIQRIFGTDDTSFIGLLKYSNFPTLTRLMRKTVYDEYVGTIHPEDKDWIMSDYPEALYFSAESKIRYFDDVFAVYRFIPESASHSSDISKLIKFYDSADDVRYFFINKYINNTKEKEELVLQTKRNCLKYKLHLFLSKELIEKAKLLLAEGQDLLNKKERLKYYLLINYPFVRLVNRCKVSLKNRINRIRMSR